MIYKTFAFLSILVFSLTSLFAQGDELKGWHLQGASSKRPGTSIDDVYKNILKNKPGYECIVAVIDGGVDINHEDLKQNIWINPKEIPGNGIDDDHNGYIDDMHGWNFIGNAKGENVHYDTYESTRTLGMLKKKYAALKPESITKENQSEYNKYLEMAKDIDTKKKAAEDQWQELKRNETILFQVLDAVKKELGSLSLSKVSIEKVDTNKSMYVNIGVKILKQILEEQPRINSFDQINNSIREEYSAPREELESKFLYQLNTEYDSRKIVGDHYEDVTEKYYGNNDVKGPDAMHGTHVSGIIAAVRGNGIGMDGIDGNAKIMALRVVPDGDERDKDIANAIHYAVDNGARVINMSFGKGESPYKKTVDEAVEYAEKHDVLLVHAAGNAAENNDITPSFPISVLDHHGLFAHKRAKNWLEIGALSFTMDEDMIASFSNFGKKNVDIFSPGVRIYSTIPENKYEYLDGTSMASPVTAGVAALIRSYYPKLSAKQIKKALMENGASISTKLIKPGTQEKVLLSELCKSGSYINAYKALEAASKMKGTQTFTGILIKQASPESNSKPKA